MSDSRITLVFLGAVMVVGALFAPWYALELDHARDLLAAQTGQLPAEYQRFAGDLLSLLPDRITATGWDAFENTDLILTGISIATLLAALAGRFELVAAGAFGAAGTTVIAMVNRPIPNELLSLDWGAWLALGGAAVMFAASRLREPGAKRRPDVDWTAPVLPPPGYGEAPRPAGSVAPPPNF
jgi:hypothetical protein